MSMRAFDLVGTIHGREYSDQGEYVTAEDYYDLMLYSEAVDRLKLGLEEDRKACWEEFKVQGRKLDRIKAENELYLGLLYMAKELLTTISRNGATLKPADWCGNFKAEVADRIQKIDAAISSPENH